MLSRTCSERNEAGSICSTVAFLGSVLEIQRRFLTVSTWPHHTQTTVMLMI
jgi:hypothetical protein